MTNTFFIVSPVISAALEQHGRKVDPLYDVRRRLNPCQRCKGRGTVDNWRRLKLAPEFANGYGVSMDFCERCPDCGGT